MRMSRALTSATVMSALVLASMFGAAPANAATLPAGQRITIVTDDQHFWYADPQTAALTPAGDALWFGYEISGIDVNDEGAGFAVYTTTDDSGPNGAVLLLANAKAATLSFYTYVVFDIEGSFVYPDECTGIDYTPRVLTLACMVYADEDGETDAAYIGVWDFDHLYAETIVAFDGDPAIPYDPGGANPDEPPDGFDFLPISAIALDPVGGEMLAFTQEPSTSGIYTLSQDTGATQLSDTGDYRVYGADFDRGGQLWVTVAREGIVDRAIEPGESGLATVDPSTGALPFNAAWADQSEASPPITVWGAGLPATGPADAAGTVMAAALALLAGTILVAATVIGRRRQDSA